MVNIQGSPEWVEMRKNKIGGSDAPVIMGVSPWTTPYQLWEQKLDLVPSKEMTPSMQKGKDYEPIARTYLQDKLGVELFTPVLFHKKYPWMMASLDGLSADGKILVEIKYANQTDHELAFHNHIPIKYFPQLQHQLEVCELETMIYLSFTLESIHLVTVNRDQSFIDKMLNNEKEFWERLKNFDPPVKTNKDYEFRYDQEWEKLTNERKNIDKNLSYWENLSKKNKKELIALADGKNSTGNGISLSLIYRKGNIDYSQIPELENIDLEKYRKEKIEVWSIINS